LLSFPPGLPAREEGCLFLEERGFREKKGRNERGKGHTWYNDYEKGVG